jgi:alginate O-acetyltransferase complex protein AlgJ
MAVTSEERERQAERELGHTEISRGTALALVLPFLALILAVPAWQLAQAPPDARPLVAGVPSACTLHRFERALEDDSPVGKWLLPRLQLVLSRDLGVGNEQVYLGEEGWLYHRPGVDYVVGPGFLAEAVLTARSHATSACEGAVAPDPVAAIADFHAQLAARGIRLLVVPTPVKAVVAPERLARAAQGPLQNPSYERFVAELGARGVEVLDPTPLLLTPGSYLATDTHWRPEAMERVAAAIAAKLPPAAAPAPRQERRTAAARHAGDLALLLNLPEGSDLYPPEAVEIHPVVVEGAPWRPVRGAEVLLLGDSFSNVYSDANAFRSERLGEESSWGEGAGLAEQIAWHGARAVDRIVRNAGGAHAAREGLAGEVARAAAEGRDRLAGTRIVVWQFAMRELAQGDWKAVPLAAAPAPGTGEAPAPEPAAGGSTIRGVVAARAEAPRPGSVPYRDALIALHVREIETEAGAAVPGEAIVYVYGLRDDAATPEARLAAGSRIALRVEPFASEAVQQAAGSLNRIELDDLELLALPAFLGTPAAQEGDEP